MIFKTLILTSFGKFSNKVVELKEGINIIYGDNEAGKTTIHKFIEGMLYGFFKPYTKRKIYLDDYDKYMPWHQSDYFGIIKYKVDNDTFRVERSFTKSNDDVKIYDDKTGEDITYMFEYDSTTRLHQPSSLHLDLNSIVYNNTINVKQLGNRTESELAKEVKDSLINLGRSLDEDISVKNVIDKLDKKIDGIGTKSRVKTSPYGKVVHDLEKLYSEKKVGVETYEDIKRVQGELNTIKSNLKELKEQKNIIENYLEIKRRYDSNRKYEEALKIEKDIKNIDMDLGDFKKYNNLDSNQYTEAIRLDNTLSNIKENINSLNLKSEKINAKIEEVGKDLQKLSAYEELTANEDKDDLEDIVSSYKILKTKERELIELRKSWESLDQEINKINNKDILELNKEFYEYERLEETRNELLNQRSYNNNSYLKARLEEKEATLKKINVFKVLSLVMMIVPLILGYMIDSLLYLISIVPLVMTIYSQISSRDLKKYTNKLKGQILNDTDQKVKNRKQADSIKKKMDSILRRYQCVSKAELWKIINEHSMECALLNDKKRNLVIIQKKISDTEDNIAKHRELLQGYLKYSSKEIDINLENIKEFKKNYGRYIDLKKNKNMYQKELKVLKEEIQNQKEKYNENNRNLEMILKKNSVDSLNEFKNGLEIKKKYDNLLRDRESKSKLLKGVIGDVSLEALRKKALSQESKDYDNVLNMDIDKLKNQLLEKDKMIREDKEKAARLEERIKNLTSSTRPLVEINEEIIRKRKIIEMYEIKLKSLEIAKDKINSISKEIQRDFAPKLNKKVGSIIKSITNGKYSDVKITEKLDIKATDPQSGKLISIDRLSGGTIDQLYFATRLGIVDIIREENTIPLILDDCFVQYDINRLEGILNLLVKEGQKRQILLFTCQQREKQLLDEMKIEYNYISL